MTEPARVGLVTTMARAYRRPRAVMAELVAEATEGRALAWLFLACALGFVARVPDALHRARGLEIDDPVVGAVSAHLFGYLFISPLVAYGLAALAHLCARAFGATPGFLKARVALFWALLLYAPIGLALAAAQVVMEMFGIPGAALKPFSTAAAVCWLSLFAAGFAEAEGFRSAWRVGAATLLVIAIVSVALFALVRVAQLAG